MKIFWGSLIVLVLQTSVHAAEKITIAYPTPNANVTMPLAHKRGFLKEEGIEAQLVRVAAPAAIATLVNGEVDYYTTIAAGCPRSDPRLAGQSRGLLRDWLCLRRSSLGLSSNRSKSLREKRLR